MAKNQTGKEFGAQSGPAKAERTAGNMTYEKARMEIVFFGKEAFVCTTSDSGSEGHGEDGQGDI